MYLLENSYTTACLKGDKSKQKTKKALSISIFPKHAQWTSKSDALFFNYYALTLCGWLSFPWLKIEMKIKVKMFQSMLYIKHLPLNLWMTSTPSRIRSLESSEVIIILWDSSLENCNVRWYGMSIMNKIMVCVIYMLVRAASANLNPSYFVARGFLPIVEIYLF